MQLRENEPPDSGGGVDGSDSGPLRLTSFRDAVLSSNSDNGDMEENWETEDFALKAEDVKKSVIDCVPTIDFSDRLYGLIDESMSLTLIVKLLGQRISYNAL